MKNKNEKPERVVLCGASSYEQKYYFNRDFSALPESVRNELQVLCVLYTEDVGGVLTLEFNEEGSLEFKVAAADGDYLFDEIELLESLELFYRVVFLGESPETEKGQEDT